MPLACPASSALPTGTLQYFIQDSGIVQTVLTFAVQLMQHCYTVNAQSCRSCMQRSNVLALHLLIKHAATQACADVHHSDVDLH